MKIIITIKSTATLNKIEQLGNYLKNSLEFVDVIESVTGELYEK